MTNAAPVIIHLTPGFFCLLGLLLFLFLACERR